MACSVRLGSRRVKTFVWGAWKRWCSQELAGAWSWCFSWSCPRYRHDAQSPVEWRHDTIWRMQLATFHMRISPAHHLWCMFEGLAQFSGLDCNLSRTRGQRALLNQWNQWHVFGFTWDHVISESRRTVSVAGWIYFDIFPRNFRTTRCVC